MDRVFGNGDWLDSFPTSIVQFDLPDFSDHCTGVIKLVPVPIRKASFKFFNFLTKHKDFLSIVQDKWSNTSVYGTQLYQLCARLKALKHPLRSLNFSSYGGIQHRVVAARELLLSLQHDALTNPTAAVVNSLHLQENKLAELQGIRGFLEAKI